MTIQNKDLFMSNVWDWGILKGCFGKTKIEPTDLDGVIERHGRKLILETKQPGATIPFGQELTLKSFVQDGHSVYVIWGQKDKPQKLRIITPFRDSEEEADLKQLRLRVHQWFEWADNQELERADPVVLATALWRRNGSAFCDVMQTHWAKLDEQQRRTG
jgi:hypothetical protein